MKKKLIIGVSLVFVVIAGLLTFRVLTSRGNTPQTKEEAILQAQEYKSEGLCTQALVPAVHKATGAKHTFSSGCLAPGWEPEQ